jgi:hypothetical protein
MKLSFSRGGCKNAAATHAARLVSHCTKGQESALTTINEPNIVIARASRLSAWRKFREAIDERQRQSERVD